MDEQPVQLVKETRVPIPATRRARQRVDYEYERAGTANIFMFTEPLAGWREVAVRDTKTKVDWAVEVARLLEGRYAKSSSDLGVRQLEHAHQRRVLRDLPAGPSRQLVRRLEFCHTPKHGSWLNIAENELSSMTRQCVAGRRFGDVQTLRAEIAAWSADVNSHPTRRRLANENRRRPLQTQVRLPQN